MLPLGLLVLALVAPVAAQDRPRHGGELVFVVPSEPPSYDAHREETFGVIHPLAPHSNTLLRIDASDQTGTKIVELAVRGRFVRQAHRKSSEE
jgi:hypothetical protein